MYGQIITVSKKPIEESTSLDEIAIHTPEYVRELFELPDQEDYAAFVFDEDYFDLDLTQKKICLRSKDAYLDDRYLFFEDRRETLNHVTKEDFKHSDAAVFRIVNGLLSSIDERCPLVWSEDMRTVWTLDYFIRHIINDGDEFYFGAVYSFQGDSLY